MTTLTFDTHAFIKKMVAAGMPEAQAEAVTSMVREAQDSAAGGVATKADIREETAPMKAELPLMKWMLGFVLAFQIGIFVKMFIH